MRGAKECLQAPQLSWSNTCHSPCWSESVQVILLVIAAKNNSWNIPPWA